ncbi:MAG: hypothetical protein RLZZ517_365 [Candidatus Parcubacteria bacterium]|jgi:hypothetical protein
MHFTLRVARRIIYFILTALALWLFVFKVYSKIDEQIKFLAYGILVYFFVAYIIVPPFTLLYFRLTKRHKIPRTTHTADGLLADPVNIILYGTEKDLIKAFQKIGWHKADKMRPKSILKMIYAFIFNKEYKNAPFSSLYLFGQKQDIGFQQPIGTSPRKRHHVRFWNFDADIDKEDKIWIGAASRDIGFGFESITYQLSHRVDVDIDKEREYLFGLLIKHNVIENILTIKSGGYVFKNKYKTDGTIDTAWIKDQDLI